MDLNKSKMKSIKAYLELEPNFPGVATPQSSEWIIYIISYAYNQFTAPWGGRGFGIKNKSFWALVTSVI